MNRIFALAFLALPMLATAQHTIEFIGEKIDFAIDRDRFSVNGIYVFVNKSESTVKQTILFPFSPASDSIILNRVFNLTYSENIDYQKVNNAVTFKTFAFSKDTIKVNISYAQKTAPENIYILKSTRLWEKPLAWADYSLTVDASVQIDSFSLKPDTMIYNAFYWSKKNFYPTDDFVIWIK